MTITTLIIKNDLQITLNKTDLRLLEGYTLTYSGKGRKITVFAVKNGKKERLSRLLTSAGANQLVRFKSDDRLDFRSENLEVLTYKKNGHKYGANRTGKTSKYHGVYYDNTTKRWVVSMIDHGKAYKEHYYKSEDEAAIASDYLMRSLGFEKEFYNYPLLTDLEISTRYHEIRALYGTTREEIRSKAQQGLKSKKNTASMYVGIYYDKRRPNKPWCARIKCQGKGIHLGSYEKERDAAEAYNDKALELYGPNATVNDI
ncbi:MAG: hypothetical protein PF505_03730 [Vallitaleaceae bacterium]|jgi:hypothetical protein|nr:hypothetical protein [Vallitaleaceae bacterium]